MFRAITLILCFTTFASAQEIAEEIDWAATTDGKLLTVFIDLDEVDEREHVCILEMQDGQESAKTLFEHPPGVFLSSPVIAVNQMGQASVAWIESDCISSTCYTSFYDGTWGEPEAVSDPNLRVFSTPSLTMDSEYDASVAFLSTDSDNKTYLQLNHLKNNRWIGPETLYTTRKSLTGPSLAADLFGKKFVSWINTSDGTVQVIEKLPRSWKISLVSPARADLPARLAPLADGTFMLAWMTPQNSLQTAQYTDGWNFLEELPIENEVLSFMLTDVEDSVMLVWILDTDDLTGEMALFNGQSWDRIDLADLFMDFEDDHDL